jgi:hypothetical protein
MIALASLAESVDAFLTAIQLRRGDRADILQTVRWQSAVLSASKRNASAEIRKTGDAYIQAWGIRKAKPQDAPAMLWSVRDAWKRLAKQTRSQKLLQLLEASHDSRNDLDQFQGIHAGMVRELERVSRSL